LLNSCRFDQSELKSSKLLQIYEIKYINKKLKLYKFFSIPFKNEKLKIQQISMLLIKLIKNKRGNKNYDQKVYLMKILLFFLSFAVNVASCALFYPGA
jgi:hypothetical protein